MEKIEQKKLEPNSLIIFEEFNKKIVDNKFSKNDTKNILLEMDSFIDKYKFTNEEKTLIKMSLNKINNKDNHHIVSGIKNDMMLLNYIMNNGIGPLPKPKSINSFILQSDYFKKFPFYKQINEYYDWVALYLSGRYSDKDKYLYNIPLNIEKFLKQFIKPGVYEVYRGLSFNKKDFKKWVDTDVLSFNNFLINDNLTLNINQISSWTLNLDIAKEFSDTPKKINVILYTKVNSSNIFGDFSDGREQEIVLNPGIYKCKIIDIKKIPYNVDLFNIKILDTLGHGNTYNETGMYINSDDIQHYIKFYKNPLQGLCEYIANKIYTDFGIFVPKSTIGIHNEKVYIANKFISGNKVEKLTKEISTEIVYNIIIDILLSNWDVLGKNYENLIIHKNGGVFRIDNGGSLLFRAQGELKPDDLLYKITEWDNFTNRNINYEYSKVFEISKKANVCENNENENLKNIYYRLLRIHWDERITDYLKIFDIGKRSNLNIEEFENAKNKIIDVLKIRTDLILEALKKCSGMIIP